MKEDRKKKRYKCYGGSGSAVYGLGLIGAAIYFLQGVTGFGPIVLALLKSLVWPVFFVLKLFEFLKI